MTKRGWEVEGREGHGEWASYRIKVMPMCSSAVSMKGNFSFQSI